MRIALMADLHLGNHLYEAGVPQRRRNTRCRIVEDTLRRAFALATHYKCAIVILAGDVFDTDHPYPAMLEELLQILDEAGMTKVVISGNHDEDSQLDSAVSLARFVGAKTVVGEPYNIEMPGLSIECLPYGVLPTGRECDIVVAHHGIYDEDANPYMKLAQTALSVEVVRHHMTMKRASFYFAGDWHPHRNFGHGVFQIGTLAPVSWGGGNAGHEGSFLILDTDKRKVARVMVPGPRFLNASSADEVAELIATYSEPGHHLFIEVPFGREQALEVPDHVKIRYASTIKTKAGKVRHAAIQLSDTTKVKDAARQTVLEDPSISDELKHDVLQYVERYL